MSALDYIGPVKEPTRQIAAEIASEYNLPHYPSPYDGPVMWGYNNDGAEHGTGRALDIMVRNDTATGHAIAAYLWTHRERFGLIHLIWRQRIRSTQVSPGAWRGMENRGSPTNNHMDHIHVLFDGRAVTRDGGTQDVAFEVPPVVEPQERYWQPTSERTTEQIQAIVGVTVDGYYGAATRSAVRELQKRLGVTADGYFGPSTEAAYEASLSKPKPKPKRRPKRVKVPRFPLPRGWYFGPKSGPRESVSGFYGHRDGLRMWQQRMADRGWSITPDGYYGPATKAVVVAFQKEKGLTVDGLIGASTWRAAWSEPVT